MNLCKIGTQQQQQQQRQPPPILTGPPVRGRFLGSMGGGSDRIGLCEGGCLFRSLGLLGQAVVGGCGGVVLVSGL